MEEKKIINLTIFQPKITLKKTTKGYTWEVVNSGDKTLDELKKEIDDINLKFIKSYGSKR